MDKTLFIMLIGCPASGKSTVANDIANHGTNIAVMSSDAIRKELYGSESVQNNPHRVFSIMNERTLNCLKSGVSVVYDATNCTVKNRKGILSKVKRLKENYNISITAIVLQTPLNECIERDHNRERKVTEKVITRYYNSMEFPTKEEGFDNIYKCKTENGLITYNE